MTTLTDLIAARQRDGARLRFHIAPDWLQGRTAFGGLIAALAVQAMRDVAAPVDSPTAAPLRALQTSFVGPVAEGEVMVDVELLRAGRNVSQVQARVTSGGSVAAVLLAVFGSERASALPATLPEQTAATLAPEAVAPLPFVDGVAPAFIQHFDSRWGDGALPYSGRHEPQARIHIRSRDADAATLPAELLTVMMADVSPTPAISHFTQRVPASSVSWALELRPLADGVDRAGWWRADNEVVASGGGYVNQRSTLWAPDGRLAALAYQLVAVFG